MSPSILRDLLRGALAAVAGLSTFWFVFWLPCSILLPEGAPGLVPFAISFVSAAAVGRFVWRRSAGMSGGLASQGFILFIIAFFSSSCTSLKNTNSLARKKLNPEESTSCPMPSQLCLPMKLRTGAQQVSLPVP